MRVLIVHNRYQQRGGEDSVVDNDKLLLEKYGHTVELATVDNKAIQSPLEKLTAAKNVAYSDSSLVWCRERIADFKPDIVHVHNFFPILSPSIYDACEDAGVPVVQSIHNFRIFCANGLFLREGKICELCLPHKVMPAIRYRCYRGSLLGTLAITRMIKRHRGAQTWEKKLDRIIVATEFTRSKLAEGGIPREQMRIRPHVVFPRPRLKNSANGNYAVYLGRLSEEKGITTLLAAWEKIEYPLHIIGDGPLADLCRSKANKWIKVLGRLSDAEVAEQLQNASFVVIPSSCYENFPVVVAEAYSYGVPIVASKIGSLQELIVDGETGLHFAAQDAGALQAAVQRLVTTPGLQEQLRAGASRYYSENLSEEKIYARTMEVYKEALAP